MTMVPNEYALLKRCVEDGAAYGYMRAFKYCDTPPPEVVQAAIIDAIMLEVCEWFGFTDEAPRCNCNRFGMSPLETEG